MSSNESDEEIILSYKNGDREAFKKLIDRYTAPLYNFTARTAGRNNSPDIVQEVFIKVWKNIRRFNGTKAGFKTWIFTITKNATTDFLRKSGSASGGKKSINFSDLNNPSRSELYNNNNFEENIPDENLLPDEALQKLEDSQFLNELLEKLRPAYREVLILHYQEEMSFEEIGKVLTKPLNTVKSQHRRAILEMQKIISASPL